MSAFLHQLSLAAPLFALVFVGYGLMRFSGWPAAMSDNLSRFVFSVAMPAMLFRMMSDLSRLPPVDARLLMAFFGSCLIVFILGRLVAWKLFGLDGAGQSLFGLGGVFSNNVLLGIPLAKVTLGEAALPSVALVLVFNSLTLWTWLPCRWSGRATELHRPRLRQDGEGGADDADRREHLVRHPVRPHRPAGARAHRPAAGDGGHRRGAAGDDRARHGPGEYGIREGWQISTAITAVKLLVQPLVVWLLARLLGLPPLETRVVVLLASLAVGANVYLMARQFKVLEGPVAGSLLLSTMLSALTTPLIVSLMG